MDDEVLLADGREAVAAVIADAFREARVVGHEFEVGPVEAHQLRQLVERQHAVDQEDLVVAASKRALHEAPQLSGHRRFHLEADHRAAPAALEHRLELANQILGLFLDFDFGVADDAEGALPFERITRKQLADEQSGELLDGDDARRRSITGRQPDETIDLVGHADQRVHRLAVAGAHELKRDREAEIGDERERMRRIDRQRREQRKHLPEEMVLQPGLFLLGQIRTVDQHDARCGEIDAQLAPPCLLVAGQRRHRFGDARELLRRVRPSGLRVVMPARSWPRRPATRTMKNSSRLLAEIERNRTRSSRGWRGIFRLLEHPAIEVQPGQLAVDEPVRDSPKAGAPPLVQRLTAAGPAAFPQVLQELERDPWSNSSHHRRRS